jgi:hypothetical protein
MLNNLNNHAAKNHNPHGLQRFLKELKNREMQKKNNQNNDILAISRKYKAMETKFTSRLFENLHLNHMELIEQLPEVILVLQSRRIFSIIKNILYTRTGFEHKTKVVRITAELKAIKFIINILLTPGLFKQIKKNNVYSSALELLSQFSQYKNKRKRVNYPN